jgi:succinate dehydrogenase/fumarate reductase flavoprotein subunit
MQVGAVYPGVGYGICGASVTGARAGISAAEYAKAAKSPQSDDEGILRMKKAIHAPLQRKGGFSPRWVTQVLRNTMIPYYILYIKQEDRMKAALTLVEFMRDHLVPKLFARDAHELRLAIETKNMVFNAELQLRASIFRKESRGTHFREDYPRRNDPEWLAWVILKNEDGKIVPSRRPIPREWWPNLAEPYNERYVNRFPGE